MWAHRSSLAQPLLLKCLYQARKVSGYVYVCFDFASFYLIFLSDLGNVPPVWYFLFFILFVFYVETFKTDVVFLSITS